MVTLDEALACEALDLHPTGRPNQFLACNDLAIFPRPSVLPARTDIGPSPSRYSFARVFAALPTSATLVEALSRHPSKLSFLLAPAG